MSDHEFKGDTPSTWSDTSIEGKKRAAPKANYPANFRTVESKETTAMQHSLSSYINSPTGKIVVGSKVYHVHSSLLKEKMPWLFAYLDDKFLRTKTCRLDSWSEDVFDQVVLWLYQGRFEVPEKAGLMGYTDIYRFATRFDCERLQNQAVDATRKYCLDFQISQYIIQNYAGLLGEHIGGQMSKFLIDQLAHEMVFYGSGYENAGSKEDFEVFFEADPKTAVTLTFTLRGIQERKFQGKSRTPCQYFACKYHDHMKTPSCKSVVEKTAVTNALVVSNVEELNNEWNQSNSGIASSSKTPAANVPSGPGMPESATFTVPPSNLSALSARFPVSNTTPRSSKPKEGAASSIPAPGQPVAVIPIWEWAKSRIQPAHPEGFDKSENSYKTRWEAQKVVNETEKSSNAKFPMPERKMEKAQAMWSALIGIGDVMNMLQSGHK